MKHHYAIESCTQETLYYYYAVDMKVNGLKCSRSQTSGNSLDSQAIGPQIHNPLPPDPSLVVFNYSLDKDRVDVCTFRKKNSVFMSNSLKLIIKL